MVCCVYSLESPRWGDSNENTQQTFIFKKIEKKKKKKKKPFYANWSGPMINTH